MPISYTELAAWAELTGNRPEPWEIDALRRLDMIYLAAYAKNAELRRNTQTGGGGGG